MNICGCLIHVDPKARSKVRPKLEAFEGVEVHAVSDDGRFVIVVEDTPEKRASDIIMDLHQVPGVISLTLTYHHFEELPRISTKTSSSAGGHRHDYI